MNIYVYNRCYALIWQGLKKDESTYDLHLSLLPLSTPDDCVYLRLDMTYGLKLQFSIHFLQASK